MPMVHKTKPTVSVLDTVTGRVIVTITVTVIFEGMKEWKFISGA